VTDLSQIVTEIVTEKFPSQFFCDGNSASQNFCDGNCDGLFPSQKKFVTEIVMESPSQFPAVEVPWGRKIVTDWVISVTKL